MGGGRNGDRVGSDLETLPHLCLDSPTKPWQVFRESPGVPPLRPCSLLMIPSSLAFVFGERLCLLFCELPGGRDLTVFAP